MSHINTLVAAVLDTAASFTQRVDAVRKACPKALLADKAGLTDFLRPAVAKYHGITLTEQSTKRMVFPADHAKTNAAKLDLSRLVRRVMGETSAHKAEPVAMRFNAAQKSAAQSLLDACGGDMARVRAVLKAVQG